MNPPSDPISALQWAKDAVAHRNYDLAPVHFPKQLRERGFIVDDAFNAIRRSRRCEAYPDAGENGGTSWRIRGPALSPGVGASRATTIIVGVETYWEPEAKEKRVVLITIFNPEKKGGKR